MAGRCRMLAASLVVGVAAGCSASSPSPPAAVTHTVAAATATATPSAAPSVLVGGVAVDDVCAFIASDLPRLADQAKVGTLARLAADLSDFYAGQGLPRPEGTALDTALTKACPDVRAAALVATNQTTLRSL